MSDAEKLETAKHIINEIWWMARRYADGRSTYAPGMYNRAIYKAQNELGMEFRPDLDESVYAKDGDEYKGIVP